MPETTDTLRWTAKRHAMLREIASDRDYVLTVARTFDHNGGVLTIGEINVLSALRRGRLIDAVPQDRPSYSAPIELTESGRALLSRWDTEHPEGGER